MQQGLPVLPEDGRLFDLLADPLGDSRVIASRRLGSKSDFELLLVGQRHVVDNAEMEMTK